MTTASDFSPPTPHPGSFKTYHREVPDCLASPVESAVFLLNQKNKYLALNILGMSLLGMFAGTWSTPERLGGFYLTHSEMQRFWVGDPLGSVIIQN